MKRVWTVFVMTALLMLCSCGQASQPVESLPPQQELSDGFALSEESSDLTIAVGEFVLHYPAMWEDRLIVHSEKNGAVFFAEIDEHDPLQLFEITFDSDDNNVGSIGDRAVSVLIEEPEFDDTWVEGEISAYHAMQEDINYVFDQMKADYGFRFN